MSLIPKSWSLCTRPLILLMVFSCILGKISAQEAQDSIQQIESDLPADQEEQPDQVIQPDNEMILYTARRQDLNLFKYHISLDGNFTAGNINRELLAIRSAFELDLHKTFRLSTSPTFIYGRQTKVLSERELLADLRASLFYRKKLYPMAFTSFEKSNLRKIISRQIVAGGFTFKVLEQPKAFLTLTNLVLYENTDYVSNDRFSDRKLWRNSTKLQGEYKLKKEKFIISHSLYFQPAISQKNVRWNGNMVFRYLISKKVSLRTVIEDSYESLVVPGRKKNDFRLMFGLGIDGVK